MLVRLRRSFLRPSKRMAVDRRDHLQQFATFHKLDPMSLCERNCVLRVGSTRDINAFAQVRFIRHAADEFANLRRSDSPLLPAFALDSYERSVRRVQNQIDSAVTLSADFLNFITQSSVCVGHHLFELLPSQIV